MAAVVIGIAHVPYQRKKAYSLAEQCLPRIGVLNGNSDSTGCVRGGREENAIILSLFILVCFFVAIQAFFIFFTLPASLNALSEGNGI